MYDDSLRPLSEQVLSPLAKLFALAAWLLNRTLDGVDGIVARNASASNRDQGGYLDITLDLAVYAMLPLGIAAGIGTTQAWMAVAFLSSLSEGTPTFDLRVLVASVALAVAGSFLSRYLKGKNPSRSVV